MNRDSSKNRSRLIVASFFGAVWLIFAGTWIGWGQFNPANERRVLAPFPPLDASFPDGFGLYLRDHFGFRGWFVTLNALLRAQVLRTSTSPNVIIGEKGFLFFAGEGAIENYMGLNPMTDCEAESWVELFEQRALWLASRNIPFVVAVVPDKETVYPEMMPDSIPRRSGKSRMDRFVDAMRSQNRIALLDLRPALIKGKTEHRTYYLTDTHWSSWGAYWAYREVLPLIQKTAPQLAVAMGPAIDRSALRSGVGHQTFDLNRMLGLNGIAPEATETFVPADPPVVTGGLDDPLMTSETGNPARPRLLFFRDSFGAALMPFLGVHFSRVYAPNGWSFNGDDVIRERPDVVILEIVERRLNVPPPVDSGVGGAVGVRGPCQSNPASPTNGIQTLRR